MRDLIFKFILKRTINFCLKYTPSLILKVSFNILYRLSSKVTISILRQAPLNKLEQIKCYFINKSRIISTLEIEKYVYYLIAEEDYESVNTPDIFNISKNNFVTLRRQEISLYLFENASFSANSDIINLSDGVYWEKANRREFSQMIPLDGDFVAVDVKNNFVYHLSQKNNQQFDVGFSLCGVHAGAWGHFLLNYLPKLISLSHLDEDFVLILPKDIHEHHNQMVNLFLEAKFPNKKIQIKLVEDNTLVHCKKLYYCNTISFLSDSAYIIHPASACISKYGSEVTADFLKFLHARVPISKSKKIYIGRGPSRNLTNAPEIEEYFKAEGFEIIYPHLLSLEEKIDIFGNATHICGPVSSGFTNFIFCKNKVKILGFFNYARAFDPFISGLNYAGNLGHDILIITGYEPPSPLINNSYYIDLDSVKSACKELSFVV
jgi:hypothetical protein